MTAPTPRECDSCGRSLTDPQSIARRLGPHCWRKEHPTAPTPGRSDARAGPGDGQLALAIPEPLPRAPHHLPVWRGKRVSDVPTGDLL